MTGWDRLAEATAQAPSRYALLVDVLLELGPSDETLSLAVRNVVSRRERFAREYGAGDLAERRSALPGLPAAPVPVPGQREAS